jgi:hypothetical protein
MQLMQPSFALVCDKRTKCFLLFIRGAISTKERLTAATAAEVPFHHIILSEGQISNVVLGYAHCGMLAGARWIARLAIPHLHNKIQEFPGYQIKVIVTNSLRVNEMRRCPSCCSLLYLNVCALLFVYPGYHWECWFATASCGDWYTVWIVKLLMSRPSCCKEVAPLYAYAFHIIYVLIEKNMETCTCTG